MRGSVASCYCMCSPIKFKSYTGVVPAPRRSSKPAKRPTRANGRATAERLLEFGRRELASAGAVDFNIDRVLRKSKVSRSSLYHHFQSREGFLVALEFERVYSDTMRDMDLMRVFMLESSDLNAMFGAIEFALAVAGEEAGKVRRRQRIETLAAASRSPAILRLLAEAQITGSQHFAETLQMAADKGVFALSAPVGGVSYLIQSLFVGRILVDLTGDKQLEAEWVATTMNVLRHLLQPVNE